MQNDKIIDGIAEVLKTMATQKAEKICKDSSDESLLLQQKQRNKLNEAIEGFAVTLLDAFFDEVRHIADASTTHQGGQKIEIHDGFEQVRETCSAESSPSSEKTPDEMTREEILDKLSEAYAAKRNDTNKLRELLEKERALHAADKASLDATKSTLAHVRDLEAENERLLTENRELKEKFYDFLKVAGKV